MPKNVLEASRRAGHGGTWVGSGSAVENLVGRIEYGIRMSKISKTGMREFLVESELRRQYCSNNAVESRRSLVVVMRLMQVLQLAVGVGVWEAIVVLGADR